VQLGTALGPGDGGTISGRASFTDVRLYEAGIKASLLDDTLFTSLCIYEWKQSVSRARRASFPCAGAAWRWRRPIRAARCRSWALSPPSA
jgi:hypothetical protein